MNRSSNESSRAEQRKLRLQEIEREQHAEDLEALKITDEQLRLLEQPFSAVKFEFCDLDGLHWTESSLYTRQYRAPVAWRPDVFHAAAPAVLSKADLARFSSEETIRIPSSRRKSVYKSVLQSDSSVFAGAVASLGFSPIYRHRDGSKERSPIKGLFQLPPVDLGAQDGGSGGGYTVLRGSCNSPDTHYDDMLQDNAYYPSCPPSPSLAPTKSFCYPGF